MVVIESEKKTVFSVPDIVDDAACLIKTPLHIPTATLLRRASCYVCQLACISELTFGFYTSWGYVVELRGGVVDV
jgi:hypothetical protein